MAIDVLGMPLDRRLSGKYITPAMETAWREHGVYAVGRPGAIEEIPPGVPLGGFEASRHCEEAGRQLAEQFAQLPQAAGYPWGERDPCPLYFQRLEHDLYLEYRYQATSALARRPSWWQRLWRRRSPTIHIAAASIFLPCDFAEPFELEGSEGWDDFECGSIARLLGEIARVDAPPALATTAQTLRAAALTAWEERLPLILDM